MAADRDARGTTSALIVDNPSSAVRVPDAVPSTKKILIVLPAMLTPKKICL
jgi:hypothetical protein